jgi:MoaA/NifB/PqqE/SkfB family radical SAM enzyme
MTNITQEVLQRLISQLGVSLTEFCDKTDIPIEELEEVDNLSYDSHRKIISIMLDEEQKNISRFESFEVAANDFYHPYKILKHMDKLLDYKNNPVITGPVDIEIYLTNYCNHSCKYCLFGTPFIENSERINFDTNILDDLIKDMKKLKVKGVFISGGGEPTLHPDINGIIEAISKNGIAVGLTTNGYNLDERLRKTILDNCTYIRISVNGGTQKSYASLHGSYVKLDKVIENIKLIANEKNKCDSNTTIGISHLFTPDTFVDIPCAINEINKIKGVDYFLLKPMIAIYEDPFDRNIIWWESNVFDMLSSLKKHKTSLKVFLPDYKFTEYKIPFRKCIGHFLYLTIKTNGEVVICGGKSLDVPKFNDYVYGTLSKDKGLYEIWTDPNRVKIGENINLQYCENCKINETNKWLQWYSDLVIKHANFLN